MERKLLLSVILIVFIHLTLRAQQPVTEEEWNKAKKEGRIDGKAPGSPRINKSGPQFLRISHDINPPQPASTGCSCWQNRDTSWHIAALDGSGGNGGPGVAPLYRNDDWSTVPLTLPFTFCLYGNNWNSVYINNNGNVSFGAAYSTFSATPFPNTAFVMVAPFWGDVDTRNPASGIVWYKLTPTYMAVQWDSVGYFDTHADKLNTFQLIITNGTDPIVPGGNVSFCYKSMNWTTGDASGGTNGFGGSPGVVGANNGDGTNYVQFGVFDHAGTDYHGTNIASGISWLNNLSFIFNSCSSSNNIPPVVSGLNVCDTLKICEGDTLHINPLFLSPEVSQTTTLTITYPGVNGYTIVSNTPGNNAQLVSYLVGQSNNVGLNTITISATDNGSPPANTTIRVIVEVFPRPVTTITHDTTDCSGPIVLHVTGGGTYSWTPALGLSCSTCANPTANPGATTTYYATVTNGCSVTDSVKVTAPAVITITPPRSVCPGDTVHILAGGGTGYHWSPSAGLSNVTIPNPVASPAVTTTYTVTVTNGGYAACTRTDSVKITVTPAPVAEAGHDTTICALASVQLHATGGTTYSWTPSTGLSSTTIANPLANPAATTSYIVTVSNGACSSKDTIKLTVQSVTPLAGPDTTICPGRPVTLHSSGGTIYSWSPSAGLNNTGIANPVATPLSNTTYTVSIHTSAGCLGTATAIVTISPDPLASFTHTPASTYIDSLFSFVNTSTGATSQVWHFGDGQSSSGVNPIHAYSSPGTYTVCLVLTSSAGCRDSICEEVIVKVKEIDVPNVFTPNGDGVNDFLVFRNLEFFPGSRLEIFDRWGVKVYESGDYHNDWNGKYMNTGPDCVDGTYYYILSGSRLGKQYTGFVQLIRNR